MCLNMQIPVVVTHKTSSYRVMQRVHQKNIPYQLMYINFLQFFN